MTKIVSGEKARQGSWGKPVLIVLIAGLALAFVVWAGVGFWGEQIAPPPQVDTSQPSP